MVQKIKTKTQTTENQFSGNLDKNNLVFSILYVDWYIFTVSADAVVRSLIKNEQ